VRPLRVKPHTAGSGTRSLFVPGPTGTARPHMRAHSGGLLPTPSAADVQHTVGSCTSHNAPWRKSPDRNASGTDPRILRHDCTHVAEIGRSGARCPEPLSTHARWQEICACRWCWVVMNHSPPPASTPYRLLYLHSDKLRPVCLCSEFSTRIPHLRDRFGARGATTAACVRTAGVGCLHGDW